MDVNRRLWRTPKNTHTQFTGVLSNSTIIVWYIRQYRDYFRRGEVLRISFKNRTISSRVVKFLSYSMPCHPNKWRGSNPFKNTKRVLKKNQLKWMLSDFNISALFGFESMGKTIPSVLVVIMPLCVSQMMFCANGSEELQPFAANQGNSSSCKLYTCPRIGRNQTNKVWYLLFSFMFYWSPHFTTVTYTLAAFLGNISLLMNYR